MLHSHIIFQLYFAGVTQRVTRCTASGINRSTTLKPKPKHLCTLLCETIISQKMTGNYLSYSIYLFFDFFDIKIFRKYRTKSTFLADKYHKYSSSSLFRFSKVALQI